MGEVSLGHLMARVRSGLRGRVLDAATDGGWRLGLVAIGGVFGYWAE
jgi:hypothetical protein